MFLLCAKDHNFDALNDIVRKSENDYVINDCLGQRFIADGSSSKFFTINRTPGNALGAYLNGAEIVVNGNAQDAVGDKRTTCGIHQLHLGILQFVRLRFRRRVKRSFYHYYSDSKIHINKCTL